MMSPLSTATRLSPFLMPLLLLAACGPLDEREEDGSVVPELEDVSGERTACANAAASSPTPHLAKVLAIKKQIAAQKGFGSFQGKDNVKIAYAILKVPADKGAIVVVPGRSESYLKYFELVHDLQGLGYSFYLMDLRGQGFSGRMLPDPQKGYVKHFQDYVDDLKTFVDDVVKPRSPGRPIVISHSTGGAITTSFMESHRDDLKAAVLVSPMHLLDTGERSEEATLALVTAACTIGKCGEYAPGQGPYNPSWGFAGNGMTHDESRFRMARELERQNPTVRLGGATFSWVRESLWGTKGMRLWAWRIKTPFLLFQAEEDVLVKLSGHDKVCSAAKPWCTKIFVGGAYHEILQEQHAIRAPALQAIRDFIGKQPTF